jgi:hypothetical protein
MGTLTPSVPSEDYPPYPRAGRSPGATRPFASSITLDTYTHVDPELSRTATTRMEELLWPGGEPNG